MKRVKPNTIKDELQTNFIGQEIHNFAEVTSTNDVAKELAGKGARDGTLVVAETQSCGRGRLGKKWVSPKGGIWFSIILRPKKNPESALKLTLMTAAVVAKVISGMFRLKTEIKHPNDVLINGKKVCGILTEMRTRGDKVDFVVIGVGINANINLGSFPRPLRKSLTSLREELKENIDKKRLLRVLLKEFEQCYRREWLCVA